jgi:site-specific recombinase XerC
VVADPVLAAGEPGAPLPWFGTTGSKSRLNFLALLRAGHGDYVINAAALAYMRERALAAQVIDRLAEHPLRRALSAARQAISSDRSSERSTAVRSSASRSCHASITANMSSPMDCPPLRYATFDLLAERMQCQIARLLMLKGSAPVRKTPATADKVVAMAALADADMKGLRDRAILLLGFAGAFRRSELVALDVSDLEFCEGGMRVHVRRSKTDQEGARDTIAIACGSVDCPVKAVRAWLEASNARTGPLLRPIAKGVTFRRKNPSADALG